jgi:hypothetical protein
MGKRGGWNSNEADWTERKVDNKAVEQEIQDKGLTAPRVTLTHVEGCIALECYASGEQIGVWKFGPAHVEGAHRSLECLTICVLVLKNGFTVTGESACASPENYDRELGEKVARQKAVDKVWILEGYALKERLSHGNLYESEVKAMRNQK